MRDSLDYGGNKGFRLLSMYERLNKGEMLSKSELVCSYGVSEKTAQRDIDYLRAYLAEEHRFEKEVAIKYDRKKQGYYLVRFEREWLTNEEVLAMSKILLESRAFEMSELKQLIDKLLTQVVPNERKVIDGIIKSEYTYYVPLQHKQKLFKPIWELSQSIISFQMISFNYQRQDGTKRKHIVKPVSVMFSEYYFYLIAFMADDSKKYPTVFRVDRISNIANTCNSFAVPYSSKFSDGEFRKRVQFMYTGELRTVRFLYKGVLEAVIDRLPTAKIEKQTEKGTIIQAEVYGDGINMWLKSQGEKVEVL